jgi:hypothetical protein
MARTSANQALEPNRLSQVAAPFLVVEYLYRDAGNYKAAGELWLVGALSEEARTDLIGSLDSGEFFVAEQLDVPPLYEILFAESGGRTLDDHAWHTFGRFRDETSLPGDVGVWGQSVAFFAAVVAARGDWKPHLSPNFDS